MSLPISSHGSTNEVRTTPALCAQGVYVGDETGNRIYRFALDSSRNKDNLNMFGYVFASQALTSALVYAGSDAGVLQARDLLDFEEGPGNKLGDANGDPLDLGAKIGSSPAVCYTLDGAAWRRWVFITTRDGSLHTFSSRL